MPLRIAALADQAHRKKPEGSAGVAYRHRLSARLWRLTILAVMLAEVLIFVPSIANYRKEWLRQKIETAAVAGLTAEHARNAGEAALGPQEQVDLLQALDARLIATSNGTVSRLLARDETLGMVDAQVDLGSGDWLSLVAGAFDTLIFGEERMLRVRGPVGEAGMVAEVVFAEQQLRLAMLMYSRNIFFLSLVIAFFAALLVYLAISYLLIRPILAMTRSMEQFGENPADAEQIIKPSGRPDEIGLAELELAGMQTTLAQTLREQRHLADLGLAVSKINHDLRNVLASAQIVSDRLSDLEDPRVQRFAPQLIRSLDRALAYTQSVLAYGRAVESAPVRRKVRLHRLVAEVFETAAVTAQVDIELINDVGETCEIEVDPEQFFRALSNLCRNAVQALESEDSQAVVRRIIVSACRLTDGQTLIAVEDTGPGLPMRAREHLFEAFRGSTRAGGTGLGLAIAAEIVEAHGGRIALCRNTASGARFEIHLPARQSGDGQVLSPTIESAANGARARS
ncbi:ATPase [Aureimonas sp. SA4125]|uniref:sensor histidine kinase n=1 Tax=Aureimonas sp. SA4125 TaxID=2826993 RepID=UPI001CC601A9|nr:HAMP domain-containing sensor histidine kinase [Aureimonas sp. SA4125]BDA82745.1 ATPase [Aureimonas sp. SA4125]